MTPPQLPQEVQQLIEREAEAFADGTTSDVAEGDEQAHFKNGCEFGHKLAATVWAERCLKLHAHLLSMLGYHEDECRFDHNGNCQEHGCFGYDGGCDVADARAAYADFDATMKRKDEGEV